MKPIIKIILALSSAMVLLCFAGCNSENKGMNKLEKIFAIEEQTEIEIEDTAKIYPSQIGNILTDKKVDMPSIDTFMKQYNQSAANNSQIEYDCIRYNNKQDYYYVNDVKSSRGIKFHLNKSNQIISASVYSGNINDKQLDLVDMVANAAKTLGYQSFMSSDDKNQINNVINTYHASQGKIDTTLPQLENGMTLSMNLDNLFVAVELTATPDLYDDDTVSQINQNANDVINNAKDKNADNPAVSEKTGTIDVPDSLKDKYESGKDETTSIATTNP